MMPQDIRELFRKKGCGNDNTSTGTSTPEKPKLAQGVQECSSGRRKTSKDDSAKDEMEVDEVSPKKKPRTESACSNARAPPVKKVHKLEDDDDDDFVTPTTRKGSSTATPNKKLKSASGKGVARKKDNDESGGEDDGGQVKFNSRAAGGSRGRGTKGSTSASTTAIAMDVDVKPVKSGGRGRGGRKSAPAGGRGRGGGGRGWFMNFGAMKDPPHKGEKEVPEGAANCLGGLTFVITGTLDSLEREEAKDLIKCHGGSVKESVSKKTNYLLCDDDIGGRKSEKAKGLGTAFLTEDGLFDLIRASNKTEPKTPANDSNKPVDEVAQSPLKKSPRKPKNSNTKGFASAAVSSKQKSESTAQNMLPWNEKYRPKDLKEIVGNQTMVRKLQDWLESWNDSGAKKAVLLSGTPGIGKTTSAKLVSKILGYQTIEVNASDSRGKADAKIGKGIGGRTSNSVKELVSNQALSLNMGSSQLPKTVLIMDEVDGMSPGDRGGVADLIASIKMSKIPIICICNDRYSQKLKSLANHCLLLNFQKPQKQQIAKRLLEVARLESLEANEIAMEELAERVNGDIRMAVNQLQYMSLSMSVINSNDIEQRLQNPFTAADKLFGSNAGNLGMDERFNLSKSNTKLVPLIIQENYINYWSIGAGENDNGKRMSLLARAAESIGDGDIVNEQIERYQQWKQLSETYCLASCIIPTALLRGQINCNRFGGWLGKNSTTRKNDRLLEDLHVHLLASRGSNSRRAALRLDYLTILFKRLTDPLKTLPKDEGVEKVVEFMDLYSISMEDFDTIVAMSKFKGRPKTQDGIQPAVKAALTRAYKKGSSSRVVRAADLITIPGIKKAPKKKRVAAMLEPINDNPENEEEEETPSDAEDQEDEDGLIDPEKKLHSNLESLNSKAIQVQMEFKADKKRGRGSGAGAGAASASKRKR